MIAGNKEFSLGKSRNLLIKCLWEILNRELELRGTWRLRKSIAHMDTPAGVIRILRVFMAKGLGESIKSKCG